MQKTMMQPHTKNIQFKYLREETSDYFLFGQFYLSISIRLEILYPGCLLEPQTVLLNRLSTLRKPDLTGPGKALLCFLVILRCGQG